MHPYYKHFSSFIIGVNSVLLYVPVSFASILLGESGVGLLILFLGTNITALPSNLDMRVIYLYINEVKSILYVKEFSFESTPATVHHSCQSIYTYD